MLDGSGSAFGAVSDRLASHGALSLGLGQGTGSAEQAKVDF